MSECTLGNGDEETRHGPGESRRMAVIKQEERLKQSLENSRLDLDAFPAKRPLGARDYPSGTDAVRLRAGHVLMYSTQY